MEIWSLRLSEITASLRSNTAAGLRGGLCWAFRISSFTFIMNRQSMRLTARSLVYLDSRSSSLVTVEAVATVGGCARMSEKLRKDSERISAVGAACFCWLPSWMNTRMTSFLRNRLAAFSWKYTLMGSFEAS